ncbi:metallophosphoesterase family protein [Thiomicrorhabdus chilensis]|uniref:metallophosphoesterase family protein n=1 Tax=Thiomicrorhabdus chilensis TaxID=63656 RepID=UPI00041E8C5E|nr:metallophosphoesterase [Thiomicrorhabdus chilensis]
MSWLNEINKETWLVSDTHFYHNNINKYEPSRLEGMKSDGFDNPDEWLIHNWNSTVGEDDLVLHLGDFAFKKATDVLPMLNGRIILVLGNHDISMINKFKRFVEDFPGKLEVVYGIKDCQPWLLKPQWVSGLIREVCGLKIMFSHYPLVSDNPYMRGKAKETRDSMAEVFKHEDCDLNIHGHVHTNDAKTDKSKEINVSVERIDFKPQKLCDLINKFVN